MFDKRRIRKNGLPAQALVLSARPRHSNMSSNNTESYDYVLEVRPEGRAPFQAQLRERFYIIESKPKEADLVQVKYDPESLKVMFDLEGDPRYDVEAMERRTAQLKWETHNRSQGTPTPPAVFSFTVAPSGPAPSGPAPSGSADDRIQALERLARLRETGAITAEEFETLKADLMKGSA
jgi:hypothetical protein